jgi:hypothetical protein
VIARPEQAIQKTIMQDHVPWRLARDVFITHIPLGGKRSKTEAAIMKGLGVQAGVPDLLAIKSGQIFFLELKAPKGRLSKEQEETQDRLRKAGAIVGTATGLDEALIWLEDHGILRGTTVQRKLNASSAVAFSAPRPPAPGGMPHGAPASPGAGSTDAGPARARRLMPAMPAAGRNTQARGSGRGSPCPCQYRYTSARPNCAA